MFRSLLRDKKLLVLLVLALLIKAFSFNQNWVERYYTYGFYPAISRLSRLLLGWIPVSVGDILYVAAFIFLVLKTWKLIRLLAKRQVKEYLSWVLFRKYLKLVLWIYILFNVCWGLNYDRAGIADQLGLNVKPYTTEELKKLTLVLQERLNFYAAQSDSVKRLALDRNSNLSRQAILDYQKAKEEYGFLAYKVPSVKASIFSGVGHYFGFSGYINPFTGEAQINTAEPVFVKPFVINHEIAHQVGYGKENEASFVSWLVSKRSASVDFRYSAYYEVFFDAVYEYRRTGDTTIRRKLNKNLHPRARYDKMDELNFRLKRKNAMQPYVTDFYSSYLKLNNQPKGIATYNEVIAWLIAYMKKYGENAI
jgi:hypothetical protein